MYTQGVFQVSATAPTVVVVKSGRHGGCNRGALFRSSEGFCRARRTGHHL